MAICCRQVGQCNSTPTLIRFSIYAHMYILIILLFFAQLSWQQKDPLNDFCRRFGHQSAVIDNKLYLDGGLVNWNPISQNPETYINTFLLYNDLTSVSSGGEPQLYANLSKNGTIPNVVGGTLWADNVNKRFYLFGGEYYQTPATTFKLLSYDVINDHWDSFRPPSTAIASVSWGAGVSVSERGEGYYYGGWNTPGYSGNSTAASSLVKYNMDANTWTTNTGPDSIARAEGVMVYLPASDEGLLIYFGGVLQPYGNSTTVGSPMSTIFIYDLASSNWYSQNASGDVPEMRRRFCAGATWASDQSSYNIYLYGGAGMAPNSTGFDDVYILTLPSFTWIKWYPTSPGPGYPHNSLTCNVINGAQMLIIGGTFPQSDQCDAPNVWGTHSLDLGKQNPSKAKWYRYRSNLTSYVVPDEIISIVGGNSVGAATVTAPATWANRDLPVYFTRTASNAVRTPTRAVSTTASTIIPTTASTITPTTASTITPSSSNTTTSTPTASSSPVLLTGEIAGIAAGGAAAIAFIALGCFLCFRRRRPQAPVPPLAPHTSDVTSTYYIPTPCSDTPSSTQYPQQTLNLPELPDTPQTPVCWVEPKYDSATSQALRNGSMQQLNQPGTEGVWAQRQASPQHSPHPAQHSPHPSQHHCPSPSHSPLHPPSLWFDPNRRR